MNQSTLPETYEDNTIEKMLPGDTGYTMPWSMWADSERKLWIHGGYPVHQQQHGTARLFIKRAKEGVTVYQRSIGDHKYGIGNPSFVGKVTPLPVFLI